jgi:hypothetical protein
MDGPGNCYLILRYGNKSIAPTADKGAIAVGDKGKLVTVLEAVIAAVKSGELDAAIEMVKLPRDATSVYIYAFFVIGLVGIDLVGKTESAYKNTA